MPKGMETTIPKIIILQPRVLGIPIPTSVNFRPLRYRSDEGTSMPRITQTTSHKATTRSFSFHDVRTLSNHQGFKNAFTSQKDQTKTNMTKRSRNVTNQPRNVCPALPPVISLVKDSKSFFNFMRLRMDSSALIRS